MELRKTAACGRAALSLATGFVLVASVLALVGSSGAAASQPTTKRPPACSRTSPTEPTSPTAGQDPAPTSLSTVGQAYHCILDNFVGAAALNSPRLLAAAFTGFTRELDRRQLDLAGATMPALSGDRDGDWTAFSAAYQEVLDQLPDEPELREALAGAAIQEMVAYLHDNHSRWITQTTPSARYGLGLQLNLPAREISPPLFVTKVKDGGPAAKRDVRPGDIIRSVNGIPLFVNGQASPGVIDLLVQPSGEPVRLKLERPSTGKTSTVTLIPAQSTPGQEENVTASRVAGDLAHVTLGGFLPGAADEVLQAIADLRDDGPLTGVILDFRENSGGLSQEVDRLLGAFVHDKPYGYSCDENYDNCKPKDPDNTVELLGLPLALLTSHNCASACDAFSAAVQDLDLGPLVGTRTAGVVSGASARYLLDDGSRLLLPFARGLGPNGEIIDEIGVAPDHYVPQTAADLSAGRDRALDQAVTLLHD